MMVKRLLAMVMAFSVLFCIPAFAAGWEKTDDYGNWKYQNDDGTYKSSEWLQDGNGYYYYFGADSQMARYQITPDGYFVNQDGVWVEEQNLDATCRYILNRYNAEGCYYYEANLANHILNVSIYCGVPGNANASQLDYLLTVDLSSGEAKEVHHLFDIMGDNPNYYTISY